MEQKQIQFKPLANKVIVKNIPEPEKEGGIIIPETVERDSPLMGEVVSVGRGIPLINADGAWTIIPLECQVGDKVLYPPTGWQELVLNGEKVALLTEEMILLIVEEKK